MMGEQPTNDRPTGGRPETGGRTTDSPDDEPSSAALLPDGTEVEYDDGDGCHRLHLDGTHESLSVAVVGAVAAVDGSDPLELRPLRNSIDPDALDDLFAGTGDDLARESVRVEFPFDDYRVVVDATGEVEIYTSE